MGSIVLDRGGFEDRNYIHSNGKCFIHRYADTGFRTKWCGFWAPPLKYTDYHAYRISIDGKEFWLGWDNCVRTEIKRWGTVHTFSLEGISVTEKVFVPENSRCVVSVIGIDNMTDEKKKVTLSLEIAVDMRSKYQNYHEMGYDSHFSHSRKAIIVKALPKKWHFMFGAGDAKKNVKIRYRKKSYYKDHDPGEKLRCFIPGDYSVTFDIEPKESADMPFIFSGSDKSLHDLTKNFDEVKTDWKRKLYEKKKRELEDDKKMFIITPEKDLDEAFLWAKKSLKSLYYEGEIVSGIFAGYPWFLEFWARDSFISTFGLNSIDEFQKSKKILDIFRRKGFPSKIETDGKMEFGFADTHAFYLMSALHYIERTDDKAFKRNFDYAAKKLLDEVKIQDGFVEHEPHTTWMDTLERHHAIEIQSLWSRIFRIFGKDEWKLLEDKIDLEYWKTSESYYADSLGLSNGSYNCFTSNPLFHMVFGDHDELKSLMVLENIRLNFESEHGISTWSRKGPGYDPSGYHTGSVWGLTTGLGALACFKSEDANKGLRYLMNLAKDINKNTIGGMFEVKDSDTGKILGCGVQAWSMSMFLYSVVEHMFGISYNAPEKRLTLKPSFPDDWNDMSLHGKIIEGVPFDFYFRRTHSGIEIDIYTEENIDKKIKCNITLSHMFDSIAVNGRDIDKKQAFCLEKDNKISCRIRE